MSIWDSLGGNEKELLNEELFRRFCEVINKSTGLHFSENSKFFFEKRLQNRLDSLGGLTPNDYLHYLLYDAERDKELENLVDLLTTNETYFMREERQLTCFKKDIVPRLIEEKKGKPIRIWSAGCSTGEEPFSITILLEEMGAYSRSDFEIKATDISRRVIARARTGIFGENAFRMVDEDFKKRWFTEENPGRYLLKENIRRRVSFSWFNLYDHDRYRTLSPFDIIFCRNVIIYFDMEAKVKVIERFWDTMQPGGFLLLGHSESLISVTEKFQLVHLPNDLVYLKAEP